MAGERPVFTIGHSTSSIPEFVELLKLGPVELVVDVRTVARSRHNPQYNEDVLGSELDPFGIGYRRMPELGGLRGRSRDVPPEVNAYWENASFHNYADYALSPEFGDGLDELMRLSVERTCAMMCAEAVWWRCHRRIIADYLIARGRTVLHLMGSDRIERAKLTPAATIDDGQVTYPMMEECT